MSRSLKAHILLVFITLAWGATFVLIKRALDDATPLLFNTVRMSLAALVLAALYFRQLRGMSRPTLAMGALVGVFNGQGEMIGKGITFYSSEEIQKIKGHRTDEIRKDTPKAAQAKPEDFVDLRFVNELKQSGYLDRLWK